MADIKMNHTQSIPDKTNNAWVMLTSWIMFTLTSPVQGVTNIEIVAKLNPHPLQRGWQIIEVWVTVIFNGKYQL